MDAHSSTPRTVQLPRRSWQYILTSTFQRFSSNQATDLAATLTYYTVLALFPGLLAVVSLMKLSGIGQRLVPELTRLIEQAVPDEGTVTTLVDIIEGFFASTGAGIALVIGVATATWAASGYVAAFSRALNRVHDVAEGRNPVKLKLQQLALTAVLLVGVVLLLTAVVVSGGLARWLGDLIGLGGLAVTVWDVARWPVILIVVVLQVAMLYHWTPNVQLPRFQPVSPGSVVAVLVAILSMAAFSAYAANFGSYDKTYGTLAGVIIALWLLWLVNVALLLGAHLDEEVIRVKQLHKGLPAERDPILELRDSAGIVKKQRKANKLAARGHEIREESSES